MRRYKVRIYGVPDKHLYGPLHSRAWYAFQRSSWQLKAALCSAGAAAGLLLNMVRLWIL